MGRTFRCADAGTQCDYIARGQTDDEVMQDVGRHAQEVHGMQEVPPSLVDQIRGQIRDE